MTAAPGLYDFDGHNWKTKKKSSSFIDMGKRDAARRPVKYSSNEYYRSVLAVVLCVSAPYLLLVALRSMLPDKR
jgi:hypothetical protein